MQPVRLILQHIAANKVSVLTFLFVGALSACVNLASFSLFWNYLHYNYQIAVSFAYVLGVLVHFLANKHLTFRDHTTAFSQQIPRYIIMLLYNYLATIVIVRITVETLHFTPYAGIIAAIGFNLGINYLISRFWVFQSARV